MEFAFLQTTSDTTDTNIYTFAAQNIGTADVGRFIIVSVLSRKTGASTTISTVTIGGISATIVKQVSNAVTNTDVAGIVIASVPTGTTGDVVVTFGATMSRCIIAVYRAVGINNPFTANANASSTANDPTAAIAVPSNGFEIGAGLSAASSSATWTGLTEDFDNVIEGAVTATGASKLFTLTQGSSPTVLIDFGTSTECVGVFVSWGPIIGPTLINYQSIKVGDGMGSSVN